MIKASKTLDVPIYATTQSSARLGPLCSELDPSSLPTIDKTAFSMMVPELRQSLSPLTARSPMQVAVVGIETHICVTQTALDLISEGHKVYVLADGVSSCNEGEKTIALRRLQSEGAVVTTSESWLYECMGDAAIGEYDLLSESIPHLQRLSMRIGCADLTCVQIQVNCWTGQGDERKHQDRCSDTLQDVSSTNR